MERYMEVQAVRFLMESDQSRQARNPYSTGDPWMSALVCLVVYQGLVPFGVIDSARNALGLWPYDFHLEDG